ncbi:MAG: trehalose-phosphatase [Acidimicrobiia bacterium]
MTSPLSSLITRPAATALICDFDGTLAPIVADPNAVHAVSGAAEALTALADVFETVAVVSGRPLAFLADRLGPTPGVDRYGLYGTEHLVDGAIVLHPDVAAFRPQVRELVVKLTALLPELRLEVKSDVMVVVHWRERLDLAAEAHSLVTAEAAARDLWTFDNRMAIEVRPPVAISKATTMTHIADASDIAMMCGDDAADYEAVVALDEHVRAGALQTALAVAVDSDEILPAFRDRADWLAPSPERFVAALQELAAELR